MSDTPAPAPAPAPPEVFHVLWVDNNQSFDEDGDVPLLHQKSVVGRSDLETAVRGILSEYAEGVQIRVFRGEAVQVSAPERRSMLSATITYPGGATGCVSVG